MMPEQAYRDEELSLWELWSILWRGKWVVIATAALFSLGSVSYALLATEWFRSQAVLVPADAKSVPALGGLGGLAALAGVSVGGGETAEALAVLRSREFAREFIQAHELMPVLFEDKWDAERNTWIVGDASDEAPDIRDGVKFFLENVLTVREETDTGLVTVGVEWTDPELAAEWALILVGRLNDRLRERALREAETNVAYLQSELAQTNVVTLQQSIGRLLESELQKLMLARGNTEFAFRLVDPPEIPKERVRPQRMLLAVFGTILGGILGIFIVFISHALRTERARMVARTHSTI